MTTPKHPYYGTSEYVALPMNGAERLAIARAHMSHEWRTIAFLADSDALTKSRWELWDLLVDQEYVKVNAEIRQWNTHEAKRRRWWYNFMEPRR